MEDKEKSNSFDLYLNCLLLACLLLISLFAMHLCYNSGFKQIESRNDQSPAEIEKELSFLKKLLNSTKKLKWSIQNFAEQNRTASRDEVVLFIDKVFEEFNVEVDEKLQNSTPEYKI